MRKRLVILMLVAVSLFGVGVAHAANIADGVVGTYTFHEPHGYRITVGYSPCGHTWTEGTTTYYDPSGKYFGTVKKGGLAPGEIWAHDTTDLDGWLRYVYGFGLTQEAVDVLHADAATYPCTG